MSERPRFRIDLIRSDVRINFAHEDFDDPDHFNRWFAREAHPVCARFLREAATPGTMRLMEGEVCGLLDRAIRLRKLYLGWDGLWRLDLKHNALE